MRLPEVYVPEQIGPIERYPTANALLSVEIEGVEYWVPSGDPVVFRIRIVNQSARDMWVPSQPEMLFFWIYPDGTRDNHIREIPDKRHYSPADAVRLPPGGAHYSETRIRTDFFPRPGIVEFRAVLKVPRNTNPALDPFPAGQFISNRYGVYVGSTRSGDPPSELTARESVFPAGQVP